VWVDAGTPETGEAAALGPALSASIFNRDRGGAMRRNVWIPLVLATVLGSIGAGHAFAADCQYWKFEKKEWVYEGQVGRHTDRDQGFMLVFEKVDRYHFTGIEMTNLKVKAADGSFTIGDQIEGKVAGTFNKDEIHLTVTWPTGEIDEFWGDIINSGPSLGLVSGDRKITKYDVFGNGRGGFEFMNRLQCAPAPPPDRTTLEATRKSTVTPLVTVPLKQPH
jgi:hypothetical protein